MVSNQTVGETPDGVRLSLREPGSLTAMLEEASRQLIILGMSFQSDQITSMKVVTERKAIVAALEASLLSAGGVGRAPRPPRTLAKPSGTNKNPPEGEGR